MAHSFCKIYVHIIFSTKNRQSWLDEAIRSRVHAHLATLARSDGCPSVVVGGVEDHVHILADIGKKVKPIDMIRHIKQESSKFVKTLAPDYHQFYWQQGYGMFSVGPNGCRIEIFRGSRGKFQCGSHTDTFGTGINPRRLPQCGSPVVGMINFPFVAMGEYFPVCDVRNFTMQLLIRQLITLRRVFSGFRSPCGKSGGDCHVQMHCNLLPD